jgi:hypothetical protein
MKKTKLEKVLEFMVNGEGDLASEMLHEHIIESARNIYADLAEEDDAAEDDLDLDEGYNTDDSSDDFMDDLESIEDEVKTEEYFGEDDDMDMDMDDATDDINGEMDDVLDGDFDDFDTDDLGVDVPAEADLDDAFVNVEDAMDELKAVFADIMGDDVVDDNMDDEVADDLESEYDDDESDDMDMEDEFEEDELGEAATLSTQSVTMAGDEDGKSSPIRQNKPSVTGHGKAVNFAGGTDEKGGKPSSVKNMTVTGPQEQKGKMDKKVAKPSTKSEKAKSNIGS